MTMVNSHNKKIRGERLSETLGSPRWTSDILQWPGAVFGWCMAAAWGTR